MDSLAKNIVWMLKFIRLHKSLALTEGNWRPENIMHEVEVKLSAMYLGYWSWSYKNLCECIVCCSPENVPRFLKNAFQIPEEHHLGLTSLGYLCKYQTNQSLTSWLIYCTTIKPVLIGHSKIDKTKVLMTHGSLMKVQSIAEWSSGTYCNTFDLH